MDKAAHMVERRRDRRTRAVSVCLHVRVYCTAHMRYTIILHRRTPTIYADTVITYLQTLGCIVQWADEHAWASTLYEPVTHGLCAALRQRDRTYTSRHVERREVGRQASRRGACCGVTCVSAREARMAARGGDHRAFSPLTDTSGQCKGKHRIGEVKSNTMVCIILGSEEVMHYKTFWSLTQNLPGLYRVLYSFGHQPGACPLSARDPFLLLKARNHLNRFIR